MIQSKVYLFKAPPENDGNGGVGGDNHCKQAGSSLLPTTTSSSSGTSTTRADSQNSQEQELEHQQQQQLLPSSSSSTMISSSTRSGADGDRRRNGREEDRFITLLTSVQIQAQLVPVLAFQYSNLDTLWEHLKQPAKHSGLIFTSPRCVLAVVEAVKVHDSSRVDGCCSWEATLRDEWASKDVFCVGPSTAEKAMELLFCGGGGGGGGGERPCRVLSGAESHAESLANKIIEGKSTEQLSLLYPCGAQRRDVLLKRLKEVPIKCSELVVYESVKDPALPLKLNEVADALKTEQFQTFLCFFSPSGVKYVFETLDYQLLADDRIRIISIGPTTKVALEQYFTSMGITKTVLQCKEPTPAALVDLLS